MTRIRFVKKSELKLAAEATQPMIRMSTPVLVGLVAALAALLVHVWIYRFLTDDAYISFRYARNLSHGAGLVFNPGGPAVEGYSNFLWVLILAVLDKVGIAPPFASVWLSVGATLVLWGLVVAFCLSRTEPGREWLVLLPAFGLALTRSFAVWATSGLETRVFELLCVAGLLRLIVEAEARLRWETARPLAGWPLALAALMRPDGLLVLAAAYFITGAYLTQRRRLTTDWALGVVPAIVLVGLQLMFRLAYYHDWLPNTYYAKVGGRWWWEAGRRYLAAFTLEYMLSLWIPFLLAALVWHFRRNGGLTPLLLGGVIVAHAFYVAAIGGDHFEYRPLDLYLPLGFILLYDGARTLAGNRVMAAAVGAWSALILVGLSLIPWASHRQFPARYSAGFPGQKLEMNPEARDFLDPARDPVLGLPGISSLAERHRELLRGLTAQFIAIRQEEHDLFYDSVEAQAKKINELLGSAIPRDARVAIDCVGVIPYETGLNTLDRLGLTDAHVAHSEFVQTLMAHGKAATLDYARDQGVELWAADPVQLVCRLDSDRFMIATIMAKHDSVPTWAADIGGDAFVVVKLPQGIDAARQRMPNLAFQSLTDSAFVASFLARNIAAFRDSIALRPNDDQVAWRLGHLLMMADDPVEALPIFQTLAQRAPNDPMVQDALARCEAAVNPPPPTADGSRF